MSMPPPGRTAFVVKGYPRLSETFIAQEIGALERRGLDILIVSLRQPTDPATHPIHDEIRAPVHYLPEYLHDAPARLWRGWRAARRLPQYRRARRLWLKDLLRDPTPNRIRRWGQALVLAAELPPGIGRLHAHFLHTPASVARYAAALSDLPWSVSAHAKDIWTTRDWEIRAKLAEADWAAACSKAGFARLAGLAPAAGRIVLAYHGIDRKRFPPAPQRPPGSDGSDPEAPVRLLSVGRAVEKKGYDDLLAALALLPKNLHWSFVHVGGGALARDLRRRAQALGIAERIAWRGALPQPQVLAAYRNAEIFVLAAKIAGGGDRDGLPNVLMEAQSQRLACIATSVSAIPELILDRTTGLLAPPGAPRALARLIEEMICDPVRRAELAAAGEARVESAFDMQAGIEALARQFGLSAGATARSARAAAPAEERV